jgi:hypothetical protein
MFIARTTLAVIAFAVSPFAFFIMNFILRRLRLVNFSSSTGNTAQACQSVP